MAILDGTEGENIPLAEAIEMTSAFRTANPDATKAFYIGKEIIQRIFEQTNCMGMRIYNALDDKGDAQVVIVGVNENNEDLCEEIRADRTRPCPDFCDINSPLFD